MSSKRGHCTIEGAGSSRVTFQIEHIDENTPTSKKAKTRQDNRRRKAVPKTIDFEVNGSLKSHTHEHTSQTEALVSAELNAQAKSNVDDLFTTWLDKFQALLREIEPVQPVEETNQSSQRKVREPNSKITVAHDADAPKKTPNYYLRQWQTRHCDSYVQTMFDREEPPTTRLCDLCQVSSDRLYRCNFCLGQCKMCKSCLISSHRFQPTHRPEVWDGGCWKEAPLHELELVLNLGHCGAACGLSKSSKALLVGDIHGFTKIHVRYCKHPDAQPPALQLISAGLFPCSDNRPESAFTLKLLDMVDAFSTVGRTSCHKIYSVLARITKPGFPGHVKDRYRELLAAYRKYLHVIKLRRAGHLFQPHPNLDVHPGDQALDCVACPRPGFNFDWNEVPKNQRHWFRAWYSYDGNFRSYRKNKKVDAGDVCFSDGLAYFPPNEEYTEWVKAQPEPKKAEAKPACDNHKAAKDNSVKATGCDVTGVGAFTCGSHSCVAPCGMVNFLKGERQIYCDFAFAAMYKYVSVRGWLPIGMTYNIWCHWWINFFRRAQNLPPLYELPADLDLTGAIGKWHLLGHIRVCWVWFSLDFIAFVGRLEGEGPERVWAHFNEHSGSTSEQGPGLRIDNINNIAHDWNFMKAIEMHLALPTRFRDAKKSFGRELKEHNNTTASLPRKAILDWELESIVPEEKDGIWTSPFMDPTIDGGFQETVQEERESEAKSVGGGGKRNGAVRWVAEAIELEHSVQALQDEEKALGPKPTPRQAENINSKRIKIRDRIVAFTENRSIHMLDIGDADKPRPIAFIGEDGEWTNPVDLGLPSSYTRTALAEAGLVPMADLERKLWRGACKDALESVKRELRGKSAAVKHKGTQSGTVAVTRAEAAIRAQTAKILKSRWRYLNSRNALLQLEPTEDDLDHYRNLELTDLTPLKEYYAYYAENIGHGKTTMSWIWRSTVARNVTEWEVEALKTEWFRSRERYRRWEEQLVITKREMVMSIRSFQSHQEIWEWKACNGQATPGMRAYACRRSRFFAELSRQMLDACLEYLKDDIVSLPWAEKWLAANVSDGALIRPCI
ncbi:hypothetical protein FRC12_023613 [Ceratobasidium sp. 428]|nr:hypothetical protein FRC12_023613 [Ceratobasidium sp. 428]